MVRNWIPPAPRLRSKALLAPHVCGDASGVPRSGCQLASSSGKWLGSGHEPAAQCVQSLQSAAIAVALSADSRMHLSGGPRRWASKIDRDGNCWHRQSGGAIWCPDEKYATPRLRRGRAVPNLIDPWSPRVLSPLRVSSLAGRILLGLLACLTLAVIRCGRCRAGDDLAADVGRLVGQLASGELATREGAEEQLVKLGPAALPFLPPPTDRLPAETAQRLARARQALEQARAVRAAAASLVTLQGTFRIGELLKEISRQSGNADRRSSGGRSRHDSRERPERWPSISTTSHFGRHSTKCSIVRVWTSTVMPAVRG